MEMFLDIVGVLFTFVMAGCVYAVAATICVCGAALLAGLFARYVC